MNKSFSERNVLVIGVVGVVLTVVGAVLGVQYREVLALGRYQGYSAYFAEAGGLTVGARVQVSGYDVGKVTGISLDGAKVRVDFEVRKSIPVGDRTEAAIKTATILGEKFVDVIPRGEGRLQGPIPLERTRAPYNLTDALADLTTTIEGIDTQQLSDSLQTLADTFRDTPVDLQAAVQGLGRFSESLNRRDNELRSLLANANRATKVLADRTEQVVTLITSTNALLAELQTESASLDALAGDVSGLSRQLSGLVADNREQLGPTLEQLNKVLTVVDNRRDQVQDAIARLNKVALALGESVASGPYFNAYLANLLPGQFIQPFIDAAFSDLGLDPNTLLPSELADPQVGQQATPALPVPFPRTGQGGEPRLTVPDAITGNPGDRPCGPPGAPAPGPGCYPYREPAPPPAPGGAPPGPPAPPVPDTTPTATTPTPLPVYVPAPGEAATQEGGRG